MADSYRIQVRGDDGKPEALEISGDIVGPFGVSLRNNNDGGFYRVTHLHSGLKISELGSTIRANAVSACEDLAQRVPWWSSHKLERIVSENGLEKGELIRIVRGVALANECDGHDDVKEWVP